MLEVSILGKSIDLTGKRYGKLVVQYKNGHIGKKVVWHCKCDCGGKLYPDCTGEIDTQTHSLTHGLTTSCGCARYEKWRKVQDKISENATKNHEVDLLDKEFGKLTAIEYLDNDWWLCFCKCGNKTKKKRNTLLYTKYELSCEKCKSIPDENLTGKHYGLWTVKSYAGNSKWNCVCDCGTEAKISTNKLISGKSTRCKRHSMDIDRLKSILTDISPNTDIVYTNNDYDSGERLRNFGYIDIEQIELESFMYKDKYLVYRSGKTKRKLNKESD